MKYFLAAVLLFALFVFSVSIIKTFPTKEENIYYSHLLQLQKNTFALPVSKDSLTWMRAITFLKKNSPILSAFDQYRISKDRIEKPYIHDGHGFYLLISTERKIDSTTYNIHIDYSTHPSEEWEKRMALFMLTGLDKDSFNQLKHRE